MSYDVRFKVKVEGVNAWVVVGDCDANITWNLREMIRKSTGLEWKNEENNGLCKAVMPKIYDGYREVRCFPEKYKKYEADNGWGTLDGCRRFFEEIIKAWEDFVKWRPELAEVATFWVQ